MRKRLDAILVAAAALFTNFLYYKLTLADYFFPDSLTYLAPARSLLRGAGFLDTDNLIETLRTPGYPLLLAAFGARVVPVIVLQHLLNAAVAVGIYLLAAPRLGRFIAVTAALLFAIDTPTIHYANKILSETLFTAVLLVVFALALTVRRWPLAVAGLLTGVLVLIRPVAIVYFVVLAAYFLFRRARVRDVALFAALALVLPCGWAARNYARTGVFTVSSISGTNMIEYRAGGTLAILDDGADFDADCTDEGRGLTDDADNQLQRALHLTDAQVDALPHAVHARFYTRYAFGVIRQHPLAFAELTLRGLMINIFDSRWDAMNIVSAFHESVVKTALDAYTAALFVFALLGAYALRRNALGLLAALTVAYFLMISAGGESEARFRVPVVPQYAILAAAGIDVVRRGAARPPR